MVVVNVFFWAIVILPLFALFFSKIAYSIGLVAGLFGDLLNVFTYLGVDCALVAKFSNLLALFILGIVVVFFYNKIKS